MIEGGSHAGRDTLDEEIEIDVAAVIEAEPEEIPAAIGSMIALATG